MDSLKKAAAHLPRVDAIGGSAAGVYVNNRVKVASLFRGVPADVFTKRVRDLFLDIRKAWNNVPLEVVNDGEVTALAGSMSLGKNCVLGISLGTSTAGGYVNAEGNITSWINELAFVPVDYNPQAPTDEWSGDYGCDVQYFSQQCVGRLLAPAGIEVDAKLPLPEKLKQVQKLMDQGDYRARKIYQTIGTYLGYAIAQLHRLLRPGERADPGPGHLRSGRRHHHRRGEGSAEGGVPRASRPRSPSTFPMRRTSGTARRWRRRACPELG